MPVRKITKIISAQPVIEGAGVYLNRVFGFYEVPLFDPFLLLDDFRSDSPEKYLKGFPWHPHRGIETITYMHTGSVTHGDSMGNSGTIAEGDVQWMTAGKGIIHQEMPHGNSRGHMGGFQLWANLPASNKMMPPRYQEISASQIPALVLDNGVEIKVICGTVHGCTGPVQDIITNPTYTDVTIPPETEYSHPATTGHTAFAYMYDGIAFFGSEKNRAGNLDCVLFDNKGSLLIETRLEQARMLIISGLPLKEPVAWHGPIVMNTKEELQIAFDEYENGTFVK